MISCKYCGKELFKKNGNQNAFCNRKCFGKYNSLQHLKNRPDCLICGKKTKANNRKLCSIKCSSKYRQGYRVPLKRCYICRKIMSRESTSGICMSCREKKFHKIYMNYNIYKFRENIRTKFFCRIHLSFYRESCKSCESLNKANNLKKCSCGQHIRSNKHYCRKCLTKNIKNKYSGSENRKSIYVSRDLYL